MVSQQPSAAAGADQFALMRWNARTGFSAGVHLMHSLAILVLTFFVPGDAGFYLRCAWGVAATCSGLGLLLLLRVGSYEGTTEEEVSGLIRRGYWVATAVYLCLLAICLYLIFRHPRLA